MWHTSGTLPRASFVSLNNPLLTSCFEIISEVSTSRTCRNLCAPAPMGTWRGSWGEDRGCPLFLQSSARYSCQTSTEGTLRPPSGSYSLRCRAEISRIPNDVKVCGSLSCSAWFLSAYCSRYTPVVSKAAFEVPVPESGFVCFYSHSCPCLSPCSYVKRATLRFIIFSDMRNASCPEQSCQLQKLR